VVFVLRANTVRPWHKKSPRIIIRASVRVGERNALPQNKNTAVTKHHGNKNTTPKTSQRICLHLSATLRAADAQCAPLHSSFDEKEKILSFGDFTKLRAF
jgi:hypothetical protein